MQTYSSSVRARSLVALAMLVCVAAQARNLSLREAKPESVKWPWSNPINNDRSDSCHDGPAGGSIALPPLLF